MASKLLDVRPNAVDVHAYAGDTLTLTITVDSAFVAGRTFTAQVRSSRTSTTVDATFNVVTTGTGATITLPASVTRALASGAARGGLRTAVVGYTGEWDCQLAAAGGADPVTTLVQGTLTIDQDVTRLP